MPATLTSASSGPVVLDLATSASWPAICATSQCNGGTPSAATPRRPAGDLSRRRSRAATAAPMPLAAPVTAATRPIGGSKRYSMWHCQVLGVAPHVCDRHRM